MNTKATGFEIEPDPITGRKPWYAFFFRNPFAWMWFFLFLYSLHASYAQEDRRYAVCDIIQSSNLERFLPAKDWFDFDSSCSREQF